ncbi:MAG: hypothetical protein ACK45H_05080 [Bacteroidota bacterium]|jgi:hypothetical protein
MEKTMKLLTLFIIGSTLLVSCNNNSEVITNEGSKMEGVNYKQIRDESDNTDARLDEENPKDEKTKTSFITSKSIEHGYQEAIIGMKRTEKKIINVNTVFEIHKQAGNEDGPEWEFKAVVRIGEYYLPIRLGIDHSIQIQDLVYDDNMQEIIINTGCFSDAGCLDKRMVIRTFKTRPFTLTDFGESSTIYFASEDLDGYSFPGYKEKLKSVLDSRELIIVKRDYINSQLVIQSFKPYKTGFAKGSFTKKITVELAG